MFHLFKYLYGINADRQKRQRNPKYQNLNETTLGRQIYDSSSDDETVDVILNANSRNAATSTHEENSSQIDVSQLSPRKQDNITQDSNTTGKPSITYQRQISSDEEQDVPNTHELWRGNQDISSKEEESQTGEDLKEQNSSPLSKIIAKEFKNLSLDEIHEKGEVIIQEIKT